MDEKTNQSDKKDQEAKKPVKNAVDLQKLKLDKLFKNIERPVHLPDPPKKRTFSAAPEFVRNVMGSSAGAGSGEFHVYRHIRRRENARVKFIAEEAVKEEKDDAYQRKLEENRLQSEQRTAKKRAKRQKKKARQQDRGKRPKVAPPAATAADSGSGSGGSDSDPEPEPGAGEGSRVPTVAAEPGDSSDGAERTRGRPEEAGVAGPGAGTDAEDGRREAESGRPDVGRDTDGARDAAGVSADVVQTEAVRPVPSDSSAEEVK